MGVFGREFPGRKKTSTPHPTPTKICQIQNFEFVQIQNLFKFKIVQKEQKQN
jgi:hypothetical protein